MSSIITVKTGKENIVYSGNIRFLVRISTQSEFLIRATVIWVMTFNLTIDRQLPFDGILSRTYLGTTSLPYAGYFGTLNANLG